MTNVGWIGLGAMGSPMASFVAKAGHAVTAFDIDPQKAAALAGNGVKAAATIGDAAPDADVLDLDGSAVVGTRSFGADTALVARHVAAAVSGLQSAGIAAQCSAINTLLPRMYGLIDRSGKVLHTWPF